MKQIAKILEDFVSIAQPWEQCLSLLAGESAGTAENKRRSKIDKIRFCEFITVFVNSDTKSWNNSERIPKMKDGIAEITVTGCGGLTDGENITTSAKGKIYSKNGAVYLIYETEDENESGAVIRHRLKLKNGSLEITKSSRNIKSKIAYIMGEKTENHYYSPFGTLLLTFDTFFFSAVEENDGLRIKIKYRIFTGNDLLSENALDIAAKYSV